MTTAAKVMKAKSKKNTPSAMAIHAKEGDNHVVGIGDLRVIVCNDNGIWFAQGLEINYAADGNSFREVKRNFEHGLEATIGLHLQAYGNIDKFLIPAPAEIWKELWEAGKQFRFSQVTLHSDESEADLRLLPFSGISYIERDNEVAA